jgi:hypothetical protein
MFSRQHSGKSASTRIDLKGKSRSRNLRLPLPDGTSRLRGGADGARYDEDSLLEDRVRERDSADNWATAAGTYPYP